MLQVDQIHNHRITCLLIFLGMLEIEQCQLWDTRLNDTPHIFNIVEKCYQ